MGIGSVVLSLLGVAMAVTSNGEHTTLTVSVVMSIIAGLCTYSTLPKLKETFMKANLSGRDLLKKNKPSL